MCAIEIKNPFFQNYAIQYDFSVHILLYAVFINKFARMVISAKI